MIHHLMELAQIGAYDDVLEVACGIGRIGLESAPLNRPSAGADMSQRMITFRSERLREIGHSRFPQLEGNALPEFVDLRRRLLHQYAFSS